MSKVTPAPSCLADFPEASLSYLGKTAPGNSPANEGCRRVRLSAATIGLAISMSATGLLLAGQNEVVLAANSAVPTSKLLEIPSLEIEGPNPSPVAGAKAKPTAISQVTAPALKHQVKPGESLWQLSKAYQVSPTVIADSNNLNPRSDLEVGQSLKIPSLEEAASAKQGQAVARLEPAAKPVDAVSTSLDNLRETRKRLQKSLAVLKSETEQAQSGGPAGTIEVADASQTAKPGNGPGESQVTALSSSWEKPQAIEIPVPTPETDQKTAHLDRAIPIAVPTPEAGSQQPAPLPLPLPAVKEAAGGKRAEEREEIGLRIPTASPTTELQESPEVTSPTETELTRPIPIPVAPLPTAALSPESQQTGKVTLPAVSPVPAATEAVYRVRRGDTLNGIAKSHGISVAELLEINKIRNPNLIKVNQPLIVSRPALARAASPNLSPLGRLPLATSQSRLPSPPLPAVVASQPASGIQDAPSGAEAAVELTTEPYQENLKAEVEQLQQAYQGEPQAIALKVEPAAAEPDRTPALNPEWASDRLGANQARQVPPRTSPASQPQLIGSAPINPQEYNNNLKIPIGTTVAPELPPLSPADHYLPDTPMRFNGYIWPTKGVVTSGYGWRWGRMHKGVDIAAPIGTPVVAAAPGEVVSAGWNSGGYGNLVKVKHPDGSLTLYAHNSRLLVRRGQQVEQGELIAEMGSTGYSTGPHLHFEVHPTGRGAVNPMAFLPKGSR